MIEGKGEERREEQQLRCGGETLFARGKPNNRSIHGSKYTHTATRRARPSTAFASSHTLHPQHALNGSPQNAPPRTYAGRAHLPR